MSDTQWWQTQWFKTLGIVFVAFAVLTLLLNFILIPTASFIRMLVKDFLDEINSWRNYN